jgi:hypothetical protein
LSPRNRLETVAAADALLSIDLAAALPEARPASSVLARQQALFHGWVEP